MSSKIENKYNNDEIDLLEVSIIIWKNKWKVLLISIFALVIMFIYQSNQKPNKLVFEATTDIKPISTYDEIEFGAYNSLIENFNKPNISYSNILKYGSTEDLYNWSRLVMNKNKFVIIDRSYLMNLFIEKLNENLFFVNTIKNFGLIKKDDYETIQQYDTAVQNLASSIKLELNSESNQILPHWSIKYNTSDKKTWEDFLIFIHKTANDEVQRYLIQNFKQIIQSENRFKKYKIEDINIEISNSNEKERVKSLEREKKMIVEDKRFERLKDLFATTPITNSDKFYAANMTISSTKFEKITRTTNSKTSMMFMAGFFGLIIGILYVLIANSFKTRMKNKAKTKLK